MQVTQYSSVVLNVMKQLFSGSFHSSISSSWIDILPRENAMESSSLSVDPGCGLWTVKREVVLLAKRNVLFAAHNATLHTHLKLCTKLYFQ